ncbi:SGNH/GDSL hydrolase family protein [Tsukamurella soli]|uniref:SGNH/GDSL hydrolase family protein n=1 Tax=Tsukamurella soli TaxID=644556 RepID=A0ABP8KAW4_9ACTN
MTDVRSIAALGSSFAAGPGITPIVDRAARRSGRNYPHLVAGALGARLTDLTVSGATTETILSRPQRVFRHVFPPQIDGVPRDADLVTITVGGNDLGYAGAMLRLGIAARLDSDPFTRPVGALLRRGAAPAGSVADVERAGAGLARIVGAVRDRAPDARVLLVDYPTVLGDDTVRGPAAPFDEITREALRRLGSRVDQVFATAADTSGAELVRASEASRAHALGSAEPWVTGLPERLRDLRTTMPYHPNATGMAAVADLILALLS